MIPFRLAPLALTAILVACTPAAPATPSAPAPGATAAPQEQIAESMVIGYPTNLPSLDPHISVAQTGAFAYQAIYDQLVRYDKEGTLKPWLASEYKVLDAQNVELKIRPNVKFHNGEAFDANVAKWNIERILNPDTKAVDRPSLLTIQTLTVVDPMTLKVTSSQPDPLLIRRLAQPRMIPQKHFEQVGPGDFSTSKAIGSGPYRIKQYFPNDRVELEAFESWRGSPKTKNITLKFNPDQSPLISGLRTGEVDVVFNIAIDQIELLKTNGFVVHDGVFPGAWYFELNGIGHPALADTRVRQALNYAIDREAIAKTLFRGYVQPAGQMVSPAGFGYDPNLKPYPYDLAKAKQLMAQAGYGNGFKLKANMTAGGRLVVETIAGMWKEMNVEVEVNILDLAIFSQRFLAGPIDDLWVARSSDGETRDADTAYAQVGTALQKVDSRYSWKNPRFDELYKMQKQEVDTNKRLALLREMVKLVHEESPVLPIYYQNLTYVMSGKVKNFFAYPDTSIDLESITKTR